MYSAFFLQKEKYKILIAKFKLNFKLDLNAMKNSQKYRSTLKKNYYYKEMNRTLFIYVFFFIILLFIIMKYLVQGSMYTMSG